MVASGHINWVMSVAYSPSQAAILSASKDATVREFNLQGEPLRVVGAHDQRVNSAVYSPSGDQIVTASADGKLRVFNSASGLEVAKLEAHKKPINRVVYSPEGTHFLSASSDATIREFDAATCKPTQVITGHSVRSVIIVPPPWSCPAAHAGLFTQLCARAFNSYILPHVRVQWGA